MLNDVSSVDCSTRLFGCPSRLPLTLCPIGGLESFDPDGAVAVASAAARFGVPMMLSSVSRWTLETVLDAVPDGLSLVHQHYAREDAGGIDQVIDRCIERDLPAFCVTVDSAVYSRRERDIASRYVKPWRATGEGEAARFQAALSWKDIARIRKRWKKSLILKGIATAEDTAIAVDHGVDVVYVSNHGGRQLDHVLGSTQVLPEVIDAVRRHSDNAVSVMVDGGYCRGTDIAKAIALGASGVGIGRLMCLALAAAGEQGVYRMLELLETEFQTAMALLGCTSIEQINSTHVQSCEALPFEHAFQSAFPLLRDFKY